MFMYSFLVALVSVWSWHPLHLSLTTVDCTKAETLIMVKVFTDDFQTMLNQAATNKVDLLDGKFTDDEVNSAKDYITTRLALTCQGKALVMRYDRVEQNEEATWWYFTTPAIGGNGELCVVNKLMNELFRDQRNLLIVKTLDGDKTKSFTVSDVQMCVPLR